MLYLTVAAWGHRKTEVVYRINLFSLKISPLDCHANVGYIKVSGSPG